MDVRVWEGEQAAGVCVREREFGSVRLSVRACVWERANGCVSESARGSAGRGVRMGHSVHLSDCVRLLDMACCYSRLLGTVVFTPTRRCSD